MMSRHSKQVEQFDGLLQQYHTNSSVIHLSENARTAQEAAEALQCTVAQIAKSIIFKTTETEQPILVIASGSNRIDEEKIARLLGEEITNANANFVKSTTGYVIGGVPPFGHANQIQTYIDEDLLQYEQIWAAAGHPKTVFSMDTKQLIDITKGEVVVIHN